MPEEFDRRKSFGWMINVIRFNKATKDFDLRLAYGLSIRTVYWPTLMCLWGRRVTQRDIAAKSKVENSTTKQHEH